MTRSLEQWRRVKLGDFAEVTVGHVGSMAGEYVGDGVIFLRSQNVVPHGFDLSDVRYIPEEFHSRLKKSALRPGDVVTVRTGSPGATAVVPNEWGSANCSDLVITRPCGDVDPYWLSYYINSAAAGFVNSMLVGAVQQHFNVGAARSMVLELPPIHEQRAIADVLGALDDKIAANRKLIGAIDEVAVLQVQAANGMRTAIADVVEHNRRTHSPESMDSDVVAHYSLPAFDEGGIPALDDPVTIKSAKFLIERPSVLISKLNPRFPRVWDVPTVGPEPAYASTEFLVLEPRYCSTSVLWALLREPVVSVQLESKVAGTSGSHQRVKPADLLATEIVDPRSLPDGVLSAITALGRLRLNAIEESRTLAATRDTLLPRLMSGELRVRDAERQIEEVL
ncbi:restriction endonuclease subunit S [Rhodococcus hoagii]|uniref:restriction endonuclease subunit S n=1 Tax=Rhodococcus hoagii TaxID=43767 RepID=UPI001962C039|nr:restriction endonuclease subunit S [Prescottella equi]MBM9836174.1 restriction endonuclease subunit S [Prescottella equi]